MGGRHRVARCAMVPFRELLALRHRASLRPSTPCVRFSNSLHSRPTGPRPSDPSHTVVWVKAGSRRRGAGWRPPAHPQYRANYPSEGGASVREAPPRLPMRQPPVGGWKLLGCSNQLQVGPKTRYGAWEVVAANEIGVIYGLWRQPEHRNVHVVLELQLTQLHE